MRDIKFRAWDGEQMIYPPEGYMFHATVLSTNSPGGISVAAFPRSKKILLMQYTGLKDKNGKEIYEGDIILNDEYYWVVRFDTDRDNQGHGWVAYAFNHKRKNGDKHNTFFIDKSILAGEIIGNIHEHAHLLTNHPA